MMYRSQMALTTFLVGAILLMTSLGFASDSCHEVLDPSAVPSVFQSPWFSRSLKSAVFQEDLQYFNESFSKINPLMKESSLLSLDTNQYELIGQWNFYPEKNELQIVITHFALKSRGDSLEYGDRPLGLNAIFTSVTSALLVSARQAKQTKGIQSVRVLGNDIQNEVLVRMFKKYGLTEDRQNHRWILDIAN